MIEKEWDTSPREDHETVFKGRTQPMTREQTKLFVACVLSEASKNEMTVPESEWPFLSQIVRKRIEAMELPIKFSNQALMAVNALTDIPGGAVVILIDALTRFEGKTVTMDELTELYPNGFYSDETFSNYVDNLLKTRKVKWAEVYGATR